MNAHNIRSAAALLVLLSARPGRGVDESEHMYRFCVAIEPGQDEYAYTIGNDDPD